MSKEKKNNITIKIFALAIAIILWSYVMSEVNPEITKEFRNIDVVFTNVEALESTGVVPVDPEEVEVNVKVAGRRSDVLKFSEDDIVAKIDLSGYVEGTRKVPVDVQIASTRVRLVDYDPKVVSFKFDGISKKEKSITVRTSGKLEQGYVMGDIETKTDSVFLKGPKKLMNSIHEVVAIVDVSGRTTDINGTIPIKLLDKDGNEIENIEKNPADINVHIPVYKIRTVPIELQTEGPMPDDYVISNMRVIPRNIEIKGKKGVVNKIKFIKTAPVNINYLIANRTVPVELTLPEGVELVNPNETVSVTLDAERTENQSEEKLKTISYDYDFDEIVMNNLESDLSVDRDESTSIVSIKVKGLESNVKTLSKNDFIPEINLQGLSEGTYDVKINIKKVNGIEIINITPQTFKITLKKE